ncbi:MAG: hypothetical protein DRJ03_08825 [Chloroflexi bacterium]|nr:MAG: hypothetical protein DRI81_00620 [Chloroflexota bacterium]RLC86411.1 MAG: hypothetical protein DRJ03_08825 [Chloroflexota bacterium]
MILSFAWTTDALLAGRKTCTRRQWKEAHFQRWVNAYRKGNLVHDAVDKVLFAGGKRIAKIRLTCEPYREALRDMPESDVEAEGGLWAGKQEFISLFGGDPDKIVAVVRFELVEVLDVKS